MKWAHAAVAFLGILTLLLFRPALATAQDLRASISGTVMDPSGAPVPGASIVITDLARGTNFSVVSNEAGRYTSGGLLPSNYSITVEAKGFKKFIRTNILLVLSQQAGVDVNLELGKVSETVTVSTTAPLLDTETASRGGVLSQEYVQDLPNNGLDLTNLVFAMPGAYQPCTCVGQSNSGGGHGTFEINGDAGGVSGRSSNGSVLIDGTDDSNGSSLQTFDPSLYAIDQVQVTTTMRSTGAAAGATLPSRSAPEPMLTTGSSSPTFRATS